MKVCANKEIGACWKIVDWTLIDMKTLNKIAVFPVEHQTIFVMQSGCYCSGRSPNSSKTSLYCLEQHEAVEIMLLANSKEKLTSLSSKSRFGLTVAKKHWVLVCRFDSNILCQFNDALDARVKPLLVKENSND